MNRTLRAAVTAAMTVASLSGCVPVNGGAVELSWALRSNGLPVDCGEAGIASIALWVQPCPDVADGCSGAPPAERAAVFDCPRGTGSTDFNIATGRQKLFITALCPDESNARVLVPEPLIREIIKGDVTELNALTISVPSDAAACGQGNGA